MTPVAIAGGRRMSVQMSDVPDDLPPVGPVWAALRMGMQSHVRAIGRKRGERFISELAKLLDDEELIHPLLPNRPRPERAEQRRAQRQAAAWLRQVLPLLLASLPPKGRE